MTLRPLNRQERRALALLHAGWSRAEAVDWMMLSNTHFNQLLYNARKKGWSVARAKGHPGPSPLMRRIDELLAKIPPQRGRDSIIAERLGTYRARVTIHRYYLRKRALHETTVDNREDIVNA